ncbi:MAG: hypothetical protein H7X71_00445 [Chitinophagales bacterium]|nr:hypothetical protein [Chitinophagales bacterium]
MTEKLIKGIDYYLNEEGLFVFTEKYLRERAYCCQNGCLHCPYKSGTKEITDIPSDR